MDKKRRIEIVVCKLNFDCCIKKEQHIVRNFLIEEKMQKLKDGERKNGEKIKMNSYVKG